MKVSVHLKVNRLVNIHVSTLTRPVFSSRGEVAPYEILSVFPHQVYENNSLTLEECGLVPNMYLLLQKKPRLTKSQGVQL